MMGTPPLMFANGPSGDHTRDGQGVPRDDGADMDLVRRCARDDPAAMRAIVRRYQARLSRYLTQLLGAPEDAEEAALDVFLRIWRDAHRFESRSSVSTWIYRIATNVAYDRLRRRNALRRTAPPLDRSDAAAIDAEAAALENLEAEERADLLDRCLRRLRVEDRLLLTLYYGEELGYDEIAKIVQSPGPLLRVRMMRARRRLRDLMERSNPKETE